MKKRNLLYAFLLAGACAAAFAGTLHYPFLMSMDDWAYVTHNPNMVLDWEHFWRMLTTPVAGLSTPLPQGSFFLDYMIGGFQPWPYHTINLLWHIGAVWLVCRLFREMGISRRTAFFLALVFAIHPQRVESVVWISERKDVMCTFFFVLSCVLQLKARRHHQTFSISSVISMTAAFCCKPSAALIPAVLLLLDFHRTHRWQIRPVLWHLLTAAGLLCLFHSTVQGAGRNVMLGGLDPLLAVRNYCMYFFKTLYPVRLCPLYPFVRIVWADCLLIAGCLAALAVIGRKMPEKLKYDVLPMLTAAGLVLGPVSGIICFSNADFADRYSYIPAIFFLAATAMVLPELPVRFRRLRWIYPAFLLAGTLLYETAWSSDSAWLAAVTERPGCNYQGAISYAAHLARTGQADRMLEPLKNYDRSHPRTLRAMPIIRCMECGLDLLYRSRHGADPAMLGEFTTLLNPDRNRKCILLLDYAALSQIMTAFADCALAAKKPVMASRIYDGLAEDYRDDPFYSPFYHGVAAMLRRDPAGAIPYFEQAHRFCPEEEYTLRNLEAARRKAAENARSTLK